MVEALIIISLTGLLALKEFLHYRERKDMLDRLMSKSFVEYKDNAVPEENNYVEPKDETVELADAREELYGEEEHI